MVVVISIASAVASLNASVVSVGRVSRVTVKLLKLVRTQPLLSGMKSIIETTIASMASMVNIGALLVLLTSVYAVIGMKFFWNILDDGIFNSHANFRTFPMAMLTMFRVATVRSRDFVHILARAVKLRCYCGRKTIGTTSCTALWTANAISPTSEVVEGTLPSCSSTRLFSWLGFVF
jgi:hypothetical protein